MTVVTPNRGLANGLVEESVERKRSLLHLVLNFVRRQPLGTVGLAIVLVMLLAGLAADWIAPFDPEENDFNSMMQAPSWTHLLGTDQVGRDIFSRLVYGARTALIVGFSAAIVGGLAGLVLGVASAYFGGWFDLVFQRVLDVLMAFPLIILALAVVAFFGGAGFLLPYLLILSLRAKGDMATVLLGVRRPASS